MRNYSVLVAILGTTLSMSALAENQPPQNEGQQPPTFEQMDANHDNKLSPKEVKGPLFDDFKKIDVNGDGFLTKDELPKPPKKAR